MDANDCRQALETRKPQYIIRADIKSYYKSIQHHLLLRDIKHYYNDPNVYLMLENIIKASIETPRGYKNPDNGIALRGLLSQFFIALYLKPLDHFKVFIFWRRNLQMEPT